MGFPFFRPADLTAVYGTALGAGIQPAHCRRVIRSLRLPTPEDTALRAHWPWRIKVHALGHFRLVLDGDLYTSAGKAQQKPLELLKALVALGGEAVPQERLADLLWPDADGDRAASNLNTVLHRLRKLLGRHDFVLLHDGMISLNRQYVWTDIQVLEQLWNEIDGITVAN